MGKVTNNFSDVKEGQGMYSYEYVRLRPEEQIGEHEQPTWEVSMVLVGSGRRVIGGEDDEFSLREVIVVPPKVRHGWVFRDDRTDSEGMIHNISFTFGEDFMDVCSKMFAELREAVGRVRSVRCGMRITGVGFERLSRILRDMREESAECRLLSAMRVLVEIASWANESASVGVGANVGRVRRRMERIDAYVSCNFHRDFSLDDIARHVGMNRSAFCVFFRRQRGKTFVRYLNEYKVGLACRLLEDDDKTIAEVCYESGFNDVSYFNRMFKRVCGVSPRAYRKGNL